MEKSNGEPLKDKDLGAAFEEYVEAVMDHYMGDSANNYFHDGFDCETQGKKVKFYWFFRERFLEIINENDLTHRYHFEEILQILNRLEKEHGISWFPLANNVAKMGNGTEKPGLGMAILEGAPGNITHAQGASYLGVVLEKLGIFEWNGKRRGIKWRILKSIKNKNDLMDLNNDHFPLFGE